MNLGVMHIILLAEYLWHGVSHLAYANNTPNGVLQSDVYYEATKFKRLVLPFHFIFNKRVNALQTP